MGSFNVFLSFVGVVLLSSAVRAEYYCGRANACYMVPFGCDYGDCDFEVVWSKQENTTKFDFKIAARTTGWVAVGFSSDMYMGSDDVLMCMVEGDEAKFAHRYNKGRDNVAAVTSSDSIAVKETLYKNGVVSCRVERQMSITNNNVEFDLSTDWYILFAQGPIQSGNPAKHDKHPKITKDKIDVLKLVVIGPEQVTGSGHVTQAGILFVLCTTLMAAFTIYQ